MCLDGGGTLAEDSGGLSRLRSEHSRYIVLQNTGLFKGDFGKRVTKDIAVVVVECCESNGTRRGEHVRRVRAPTNTNLYDCAVDALPRKDGKRHYR